MRRTTLHLFPCSMILAFVAACQPSIRNQPMETSSAGVSGWQIPGQPGSVSQQPNASETGPDRKLKTLAPGQDDPSALMNRYDFEAWIMAHDHLPAESVILTLSGGGTRAATLAQSVIVTLGQYQLHDDKLGDRSLADNIIAISATSGGTMTAGRFVADDRDGVSAIEGDFERDILQHKLSHEGEKALLLPFNWHDRARVMENLMESIVGTQTYGDVAQRPDAITAALLKRNDFKVYRKLRPFLFLNSTDIIGNRSFSFTQQRFSDICSDLNQFHLASAMTAASAFPFILSDIEIRNYRDQESKGVDCDDPSAGLNGLDPNSSTIYTDLAGYTDSRYRASLRYSYRDCSEISKCPFRRYQVLHLFDGGLDDNLGIRSIARALSPDVMTALYGKGVRDILFIEVDARSDATDERGIERGSPFFLSLMEDTSYGPIDMVSNLSAVAAIQLIGGSKPNNSVPMFLDRPGNDAAIPPPERPTLRPIIIDFDQLGMESVAKTPGSDQPRKLIEVKEISTMEGLDPEDVRFVQYIGRKLLSENPCFSFLALGRGIHYEASVNPAMNEILEAAPNPNYDLMTTDPSTDACNLILKGIGEHHLEMKQHVSPGSFPFLKREFEAVTPSSHPM